MRRGGWVLVVVCGFSLGAVSLPAAAPAWPGWRGPRLDGHSTEKNLPTKWSNQSIAWSVGLPGQGHSSPTIWGDRVFLTASLEKGRKRVVLCVDRRSKAIAWQHTAFSGPAAATHSMNGWASASCVTDGELVYAFFGEGGGVHCYRVDGTPVWQRAIGVFDNKWGSASSPVLVGNAVIQLVDSDRQAYITALDRRTGKPLWKTPREFRVKGTEQSNFRGWSTPVLIRVAGRDELVVNGHAAVCAYDPKTGKELWRVMTHRGRGTPTVTPGHGLLYASNGSDAILRAIRPGGNGDVTTTQVAWQTPRKSRDIPSPIVVGDYVLIVSLRGGILGCYEAKSGRQLWLKRLGTNFSASPVSWNGLAFFLNEAGETFVIKPGPTAQVVARNRIESPAEEVFRASITPLEGRLYLRSTSKLHCIGPEGAGQ